MLMIDNLMALTHLGYLHAKTVGGDPGAHIGAAMKTEPTTTGIKSTRWMRNSFPPPTYVKAAGFRGRVDRWQVFEFMAPSSVSCSGPAPQTPAPAPMITSATAVSSFACSTALPPQTDTSCFYFRSVANGYRQNEPDATEQLHREVAPTFVEDRVMVEAQQARMSEFGEPGLVDIASDATRMQMRRIV